MRLIEGQLEQAERIDFFAGGEPRRSPGAQRYYDLITERHRGKWTGEVSPVKRKVADPAQMSREVKRVARRLGADLVGTALLNQAFVYKGRQVPHKYAVALGMAMDYEKMATAPSPASEEEASRVYYELAEVNIKLGGYIRGQGYSAYSHHPLGGGSALLIPNAVSAGLGELGRNGILVSKEFGPCLRLACVTTDLPLAVDPGADLGVEAYCQRCQVCRKACPAGAIASEARVVRGVEKYPLDRDKCRPFVNEHQGCAICIRDCVFTKLAHAGRWL